MLKKKRLLAVNNLEFVLQCPGGEASSLDYISKINVFHFTPYESKGEKLNVLCY